MKWDDDAKAIRWEFGDRCFVPAKVTTWWQQSGDYVYALPTNKDARDPDVWIVDPRSYGRDEVPLAILSQAEYLMMAARQIGVMPPTSLGLFIDSLHGAYLMGRRHALQDTLDRKKAKATKPTDEITRKFDL